MDSSGRRDGSEFCRFPLLQLLAGFLLFLLLMGTAFFYPQKAEGEGSAVVPVPAASLAPEPQLPETPPAAPRLFAHSVINVRSGPGLQYRVIGKLFRGEGVELDRSAEGWGRIIREEGSAGFVSLDLLRSDPLPTVEIVKWDWKPAPRMGRSGVVVWMVEVRNNSARTIDYVGVEFETFDTEGRSLERDVAYLRKVEPGGAGGARSFATFTGREKSAEVRLVASGRNAEG